MLADLLAKYPNIPDVWGEGTIFAFSGLDGETNAASGFVATYARDRYGLLLHTPTRRFLDVALPGAGTLPGEGTPRIATGDVLAVQTPGGDLLITLRRLAHPRRACPAGRDAAPAPGRRRRGPGGSAGFGSPRTSRTATRWR